MEAPTILLIEDDPSDALLTQEALECTGESLQVDHSADGADALRRLRSGKPPALVLLDLNLPPRGGLHVLDRLKSDESLRSIPVVVLTNSGDPGDRRAAYRLHANAFFRKPVRFDRLVDSMHALRRFWFEVAELPAT